MSTAPQPYKNISLTLEIVAGPYPYNGYPATVTYREMKLRMKPQTKVVNWELLTATP